MGYKVFDPFKQYSGGLDLDKGWEYPGTFSIASYYLLVRPEPAGPFGKYGVVRLPFLESDVQGMAQISIMAERIKEIDAR